MYDNKHRVGPMQSSGPIDINYKIPCVNRSTVDLCQEIKELNDEIDHLNFARDSLHDTAIDLSNRLKPYERKHLRRRSRSPPFTASPREELIYLDDYDPHQEWLMGFQEMSGGKRRSRKTLRRSRKVRRSRNPRRSTKLKRK